MYVCDACMRSSWVVPSDRISSTGKYAAEAAIWPMPNSTRNTREGGRKRARASAGVALPLSFESLNRICVCVNRSFAFIAVEAQACPSVAALSTTEAHAAHAPEIYSTLIRTALAQSAAPSPAGRKRVQLIGEKGVGVGGSREGGKRRVLDEDSCCVTEERDGEEGEKPQVEDRVSSQSVGEGQLLDAVRQVLRQPRPAAAERRQLHGQRVHARARFTRYKVAIRSRITSNL
eukprot:6208642-Pleurochrysis_carterae.AAC.4